MTSETLGRIKQIMLELAGLRQLSQEGTYYERDFPGVRIMMESIRQRRAELEKELSKLQ